MTVKEWNLLNAQIPRLEYEQMYMAYLVAAAAQGGQEGWKLAESWRKAAMEGLHAVAQVPTSSASDGFWARYSMARSFATVTSAFGATAGEIVDRGAYVGDSGR